MIIHASALRSARTAVVVASLVFAIGAVWTEWPASAGDDKPAANEARTVRTIETRQPLPFTTVRKPSSDLRADTTKTVRAGVPGVSVVTYRVTMVGGQEISRQVVSTTTEKKPVAEVIQVGSAQSSRVRGKLASRGYYSGRRVITMIATGYDPSPASNGGYSRTSTGLKVGHGVVAVDPKVIPIGTNLFIEGYGHAVAADVGSAIKGNRIDLGEDTARRARSVGRRLVRVHILN